MTFKYSICCTNENCSNPAQYKIAARWTDGVTEELKTYGLTCNDCLATIFRRSFNKQKACRLAPDEHLNAPGIYGLSSADGDTQRQRLAELEQQLLTEARS